MGVACSSGGEEHFDGHDNKDRGHGDESRHGWVAFVPEVGKAWVGKRDKCCGKEMDKCCCDEYAGAKVS